LNPGLAHVSHKLVVKLGFKDHRVTGLAQSRAHIALNLWIARCLGGAVFEVIVFTFNRPRTRAGQAEVKGFVSFAPTSGDYAAGEAADKRGILAALLVLRQAQLRCNKRGHREQIKPTKFFIVPSPCQ
jgi:hypothetical protein